MSENEQKVAVGDRQGLALPIALEEGAPPVYFKSALAILSGLVVSLLIWANIAQVRETSLAPGEITPSEAIRKIAHLEGGIVDTVAVKQGDIVDAGQELFHLRPESGDGGFARFAARRAGLRITVERLSAQASGRTPDFSEFADKWPSLVMEHQSTFDTARAEHHSAMLALSEREASTKAERDGAAAAVKDKASLLNLAKEQLKIQEKLIEGGFTSRQALLEAKSAVLSASGALTTAETESIQAQKMFNTAVAERERAQAEYRANASEQRAQRVAELLELEETIVISEDRDNRLTVRAPIAGIINNINVTGNGDVVRPGETIAEIVPTSAEMIADVRVDPKDIGHIELGQRAEVTVTTFDPKKHGVLEGRISHISADSFIDEKTGRSFYRVHVEFDAKDERGHALRNKLAPGMETTVKIITNSRSMMIYILKPIARSLENAFSER